MPNQIQVYVVDGDASARNGMTRYLRTAGHKVQPYASVKKFVDNMTPAEKSCIVIDVGKPWLSSRKLQKEFTEKVRNLPVICVSSDIGTAARRIAKSYNAVGLYLKPVDGPALLDAIMWATDSVSNLSQKKEK